MWWFSLFCRLLVGDKLGRGGGFSFFFFWGEEDG